ncbi:MAG: FxsA family protein [Desulfobacterales bacterium]|nr:FxsA family protein [Desulfobacterales bacterium]
MLFKLFLAFTLIPVAEIYLLIKVGAVAGAFNTVLLVVLTGFTGAYLARLQGMHTLLRVRASLQQGLMPTDDLMDALLIFIAGIVLLTPGFITDAAGLLILFPQTRRIFKQFAKLRLERWIKNQNLNITFFS